MSYKIFLALALTGVLGVASVYAHDASLHKGKPTVGKVASLSEHGVNLETARGTTLVTFQDKTKFERGDAQASAQEIQTGDQLTVFGTKLPSGELIAREVLLPSANAKSATQTEHISHQAKGR
jgi:hypothetical protein